MPSRVKPSTGNAHTLRLRAAMAEFTERVGGRIKQAREDAGLTQTDLARAMNNPKVDGSAISRWERGEVHPRPETLEDIAAAIGIPVSHLLVDPPSAERPDLLTALPSADMRDQLARIETAVLEVTTVIAELFRIGDGIARIERMIAQEVIERETERAALRGKQKPPGAAAKKPARPKGAPEP